MKRDGRHGWVDCLRLREGIQEIVMRTADFRENRIDSWAAQNCEMQVIDILAYASPTHGVEEILFMNDTVKLAKLKISKTRCDRVVRVLINQLLREPQGWYSLPRGSITPASTIGQCHHYGCKP